MLDMPTIQSIRNRRAHGEKISEIAEHEGVSVPTVRKYLQQTDFSPTIPLRKSKPSVLDPYRDIIEGYLDEDARSWHKQRHSARRIHERLVEEHGAQIGYTTVQLYVKERRAARASATDQYLKLVWMPGEAQVDFGEADFIIYGAKRRVRYLVVDFPFSNAGLAQVFYGENAECVCQGLLNVFTYIGGAPRRLVFDNATGVGRRVGERARTTELFRRFACHFGFDYSFCNPRSGHEKGVVENKVGATRRNLFVPVPRVYDLERYNTRLLDACLERSSKSRYAKGESERALFEEDKLALLDLPEDPFDVVTYEHVKTDKQGYICLEGNHRYATSPSLAGQTAIVAKRAFGIAVHDARGNLICSHERAYGEQPASSDDPLSQLNVLCMKPAGWRNSQVRFSLPDDLREALDRMERAGRSDALRTLRNVAGEKGYQAAVRAMAECAGLGFMDADSVETVAACAGRGLVEYDDPVDLSVYDRVFAGDAL